MKFTVSLIDAMHVTAFNAPDWERKVTPAQQVLALQLAESLGYWKVRVPEHFVIPEHQIALSGDHYPHAVTALGFVAGATERLRLASSITILPLVHPIAQAKMWATLDWLSGGRAEMNVGVGWLKDEFDLMGIDFHRRGAICDEQIEAIVALWTQDLATFEGRYFTFRNVGASPSPPKSLTFRSGLVETQIPFCGAWPNTGRGGRPSKHPRSACRSGSISSALKKSIMDGQ